MKPLWTQTLVWIAAVIAAVLLALVTPDAVHVPLGGSIDFPPTPLTPR
ncbi:MAG: hypothetical protein ACO1OY_08050 [Ramlibacter sp.]